jgi:hypothetical protein
VTLADVTAENGVVHSVDTVLFPLGHNYNNNFGAVNMNVNKDDDEEEYDDEEEEEPADFITLLNRLGYTSFARALKLTKVHNVRQCSCLKAQKISGV